MASGNVQFVISVDAQGAVSGIRAFNSELEKVGPTASNQVEQSTSAFTRMDQVIRKMQSAVIGFVAAWIFRDIISGIYEVIDAGIKFEDAMAGVRTKVNATNAEFAAMSDSLLQMSTVLPVAATELAKIAETGSQLGVAKENIVEFTKTIAGIGMVSKLSGDEATTSFVRLAANLNIPQTQMDALASTVFRLGSKEFPATTEEVLRFSLALSGVATQSGMSADQVMALATALASSGLRGEKSASAMLRVTTDISEAITGTNKHLAEFAQISEMSAGKFVAAWKENPAKAILAFVSGLKDQQKAGADTIALMNDLGLKGIRVEDVLLRAANTTGIFSGALKVANDEMGNSGKALHEAVEIKAGDAAGQLKILNDRLNLIAIAISNDVRPALIDAAKDLVSFAEFLHRNKTAIEDVTVVIGSMTAAFVALKIASSVAISASMIAGLSEFIGVIDAGPGAVLALAGALGTLKIGIVAAIGATVGLAVELYSWWGAMNDVSASLEKLKFYQMETTAAQYKAIDALKTHGIDIMQFIDGTTDMSSALAKASLALIAKEQAERSAIDTENKHVAAIKAHNVEQEKAAAKFADSIAKITDESKSQLALNEILGYAAGAHLNLNAVMDVYGTQIKKEIQLEKDNYGSTFGLITVYDDLINAKKDAKVQSKEIVTELDKEIAGIIKAEKAITNYRDAITQSTVKDEEFYTALKREADAGTSLSDIMEVYGSKIAKIISLETQRGQALDGEIKKIAEKMLAQRELNNEMAIEIDRIIARQAAINAGTVKPPAGTNGSDPNNNASYGSIYQGGLPLGVDPSRQLEAQVLASQQAIFDAMTKSTNKLWTTFLDKGALTFADISKAFGDIFSTLAGGLMKTFEQGLLKPLADKLGAAASGIASSLTGAIQGALGDGAFSKAISGILSGALAVAGSYVVNGFIQAIGNLTNLDGTIKTNITDPFNKAVNSLMASFNALNAAGTQTLLTAASTKQQLTDLYTQFQAQLQAMVANSTSGQRGSFGPQNMQVEIANVLKEVSPAIEKLFKQIDDTITSLGGTANLTAEQTAALVEQLKVATAAATAFASSVTSTIDSVTSASNNSDVLAAALTQLAANGTPASLIVAALGNNAIAMATQMQALGVTIPPVIASLAALASETAQLATVETQLAAARSALASAVQSALSANNQEIQSYVSNITTWQTSIDTLNVSIAAAQRQYSDASYWAAQYTAAVQSSEAAYQSAINARQTTEAQIASLTDTLAQEKLQETLKTATDALNSEKALKAATFASNQKALQDAITANDANNMLSLEARAKQHTILQQQLTDLTAAGVGALDSQAAFDAATQALADFQNAQKLKQMQDQQTQLDALNATLVKQIQAEKDQKTALDAATTAATDSVAAQKTAAAENIASMQQQVLQLQANIATAKLHIAVLADENTAYESLLSTLGVTNTSITGNIAAMVANIGSLESQREALSGLTGIAAKTPALFDALALAITNLGTAASLALASIVGSTTSFTGKLTVLLDEMDKVASGIGTIGPSSSSTAASTASSAGTATLVTIGSAQSAPVTSGGKVTLLSSTPSTPSTGSSIALHIGNITLNPQPGQNGGMLAKQFVTELATNGTLRNQLKRVMN